MSVSEYKLSPLQEQNRRAMRKMLNDKSLRCFLWTFLAEECGVFWPKAGEAPARDVGLRLMENLKFIDLGKVHLAEKEYLSKLEEDRAWRESEEQNVRRESEFE